MGPNRADLDPQFQTPDVARRARRPACVCFKDNTLDFYQRRHQKMGPCGCFPFIHSNSERQANAALPSHHYGGREGEAAGRERTERQNHLFCLSVHVQDL